MKQYIVDAFTDKLFAGNQAAVCVMDEWIPDELMQSIAKENNLSETAFTVKEGDFYHLRWFTPAGEIDFCGHATLGTSFVLFNYYCKEVDVIKFTAQVGELYVKRNGDLYEMDFPAYEFRPVEVTDAMEAAIGARPMEAYMDRDLLMVIENEDIIRNMKADQEKLKELDGVCIAVTAKGAEYDTVSRVFAPELNIPEDPVTGSTHCMIAPFWAKRIGKDELVCYQASERTGVLYAKICGDRVKISGKAVLYLQQSWRFNVINKEADKILRDRFKTGQLIALATSEDNKPYVRAVNAYYENGAFYVMTDASSGKMKQLEKNPEVAICGQLLNARGVAENIGHVLKPEHEELMKTLRIALAEWYSYGHVDESDPNTVILEIQLMQATVIDNGKKYELI